MTDLIMSSLHFSSTYPQSCFTNTYPLPLRQSSIYGGQTYLSCLQQAQNDYMMLQDTKLFEPAAFPEQDKHESLDGTDDEKDERDLDLAAVQRTWVARDEQTVEVYPTDSRRRRSSMATSAWVFHAVLQHLVRPH